MDEHEYNIFVECRTVKQYICRYEYQWAPYILNATYSRIFCKYY